MEIIFLIVIIIVVVILALRSANHNYTLGSGMFKSSDNNLEKDKHNDISDYNYYNDKDKFK